MIRAGTTDALIPVCTILVISIIASTYLPMTGAMGATKNTTTKVNATPSPILHRTSIQKPKKDFLTPYYNGMAYFNKGNYAQAIPYFDKALAINPNYILALNNKGAALYSLGIYNASIAYFDKVLSINPSYTTALFDKGAALSKLGIYNESIAYFDKVLALQPTNDLALAGKKLDLIAFSKTNFIARPTGTTATSGTKIGTTATPLNPSTFGYYFGKRTINATAPPLPSSPALR